MTTAEQDIKVERIDQKVDSFKETVENFIQEMRDRDNRRDADIRELRKQREEDRKQRDAEMKELRTEIRDGIKHIQSLTIAAIVGIVAIAVAIIAFVFVTWQSIDQSVDRKIEQRFQYYQPPAQIQNYVPPQNQNSN